MYNEQMYMEGGRHENTVLFNSLVLLVLVDRRMGICMIVLKEDTAYGWLALPKSAADTAGTAYAGFGAGGAAVAVWGNGGGFVATTNVATWVGINYLQISAAVTATPGYLRCHIWRDLSGPPELEPITLDFVVFPKEAFEFLSEEGRLHHMV